MPHDCHVAFGRGAWWRATFATCDWLGLARSFRCGPSWGEMERRRRRESTKGPRGLCVVQSPRRGYIHDSGRKGVASPKSETSKTAAEGGRACIVFRTMAPARGIEFQSLTVWTRAFVLNPRQKQRTFFFHHWSSFGDDSPR